MSILDSSTLLKSIAVTNQHLHQAQYAIGNTLSSSLSLATNIAKCCVSAAQASVYGYLIYKVACSEIVGNLPILSISASTGLFPGATLAYGVAAATAKCLISYPIYSFALPAGYSFFKYTDGIKNIKDTISSAGNVLSDSFQVAKELYNASDSAINTVDSALKSYLLNKVSDHDSKEVNSDAVNIDEYEIISDADIYEAASALSGDVATTA